MLFGKNSDRERNEAQSVEYLPAAEHAPNTTLTCTYVTIPQARRTYSVLLCRPFWMWGAEMGANEHGVVIGNEGLQARSPAPQDRALLGMDLIRLALERATTAAEALEVITGLLERHGQGGNCGHLVPAYYNNGFMIADPKEAFVLETVGRDWLVERVCSVRAISNIYSIGRDAERTSVGLPGFIRGSGWTEEPAPCYAEVIADTQSQHIGHSRSRCARSTALLRAHDGRVAVTDMMRILRDHGDGTPASWHPQDEPFKRTLCLHACADGFPAQTTGSMISELQKAGNVHWVTGTAAPCISIFKPVLMDAAFPAQGPSPTDRFDPRTLWWRHERFHRAALLGDFGRLLDEFRSQREVLEARFQARVKAVLNGGSVTERSQVVAECWKAALEIEDRWFAQLKRTTQADDSPYRAAWLKMNRIAGIARLVHATDAFGGR